MTKKDFIIKKLCKSELTSEELIDIWILENENIFQKRVDEYVKSEKEKKGETKFTKNQIRAELLSIINKNKNLFEIRIVNEFIDCDNANFKILSKKIYSLK